MRPRIGAWASLTGIVAFVACSSFSGSEATPEPPDGGSQEGGASADVATVVNDADGCPSAAPSSTPFAELASPATHLTASATHLYWIRGETIERRALDESTSAEVFVDSEDAGAGTPADFVLANGNLMFQGNAAAHVAPPSGTPVKTNIGVFYLPIASTGVKAFATNGDL